MEVVTSRETEVSLCPEEELSAEEEDAADPASSDQPHEKTHSARISAVTVNQNFLFMICFLPIDSLKHRTGEKTLSRRMPICFLSGIISRIHGRRKNEKGSGRVCV